MPTVLVKFLKDELIQEVECTQGQNLFQCFEENSIKLPHGCLAGSCGSCRIEILEGYENLSEPSFIENDTIQSLKSQYGNEKNIRLSCRAKINGPITFKLLK